MYQRKVTSDGHFRFGNREDIETNKMAPFLEDSMFNTTHVTSTEDTLTYFEVPLHKIIRLIANDICGILSIVLNAMNLVVLKHITCFGEVTICLLKVLAIVDLCTGVVVILLENAYLLTSIPDYWDGFCKTLFPVVVFCGLFSCFLLGLLSFDRYMAIRKPLRYPVLFTRKWLVFMVIGCGFVALCDVVLTSWRTLPLDGFVFNEGTRFCRMDIAGSGNTSAYLMIGNLTVLVAVILITYINIHLVIIAWRHATKIRDSEVMSQAPESANLTATSVPGNMTPTPTRRPRVRRRNEFRALRTVLVMTLAYYLAWLPMFIDVSMYVLSQYDTPAVYEFFTYYMPYSNSWWNPVIYLLMNRAYRKAARRHVFCFYK